MPTQINLSHQQLNDLTEICKIDPSILQAVVTKLETSTDILSPEKLDQEVAKFLTSDTQVKHLLRPVLGLSQLIRHRKMAVDDVIEGLHDGLESAGWNNEKINSWDKIAPELRNLFDSLTIRRVSKAIDLAYEYANLFQSARIVTDVRPIFNDEDSDDLAIDGAVVSFTLRVQYDNREGNHGLSIALDEADIHLLQEQCKRALLKAKHAQARMVLKAGIPTIISGESE